MNQMLQLLRRRRWTTCFAILLSLVVGLASHDLQPLQPRAVLPENAERVIFCPGGNCILTLRHIADRGVSQNTGKETLVSVWHAWTFAKSAELKLPLSYSIVISSDGKRLAGLLNAYFDDGDWLRYARVWNLIDGLQQPKVLPAPEHEKPPPFFGCAVFFSDEGRLRAFCRPLGKPGYQIWDVADQRKVSEGDLPSWCYRDSGEGFVGDEGPATGKLHADIAGNWEMVFPRCYPAVYMTRVIDHIAISSDATTLFRVSTRSPQSLEVFNLIDGTNHILGFPPSTWPEIQDVRRDGK